MKTNSILVFVATILASKAYADCFSTKLGYKCCEETNKVVAVDENGKWGVENGQWCGIKEKKQFALNENNDNINNGWNWLPKNNEANQSQSNEYVPAQNNITTPISSDYMKKLQVVNVCPPLANSIQNGVQYPTPKKITYPSIITGKNRQMNIILPVDYSENKKYPVLYLLHGILGDEDSMLEESMGAVKIPANLLSQGKAKEMIIVLPNEYAPEPGKEVEPGFTQPYFDGYDNFINELTESIMPYIEANYSILTGRENTAICGFSMGGRNSLYIGYSRPDLFGYVGAFSPAPGVTPGHDFSGDHPGLFQESEFRSEITPIVSLISCGTNDSVVGNFPKSYHEILTRNNQEHIWFEVPNADHNGVAVSAGFYNFISAVFGALDN